jgi:cellulose synthase/poly-beta-1,6-N-acetylglucosamine synthase-like glycosyltransferase
MRGPGLVYVSSLTYKRPGDLASLLNSLNGLTLPKGWEVCFLIVDNDPQGSGRAVVDAAKANFGDSLTYLVENTPGIPAARNRALKEALDANATLLCFLDDDEIPEPDWLRELVSCWASGSAALIGGPVRRHLPAESLSMKQRLLGRSMMSRRAVTDRLTASGAVSGKPRVYTNNWLCELATVRAHGLRFDTALQFSGGSDMAFYLAAQKMGIETGWCAKAIVNETLDPDRMTVRYQFERGRAQGLVKAAVTNLGWWKAVATQLPRAAAGAGMLVVPVFGIGSYSLGLHLVGSAVGHFHHLLGHRSAIYAYGRADA